MLLSTYKPAPVAFENGKKSLLFDKNGLDYVDLGSGVGVTSVGHGHPVLSAALAEQAGKVLHLSNHYQNPLQEVLAEKLLSLCKMTGGCFFANSGTEANEAAIKLVRKTAGPGRTKIVTLKGSFHGRTLGSLAATGQEKLQKGFGPLPEGFVYAQDLEEAAALADETVAAFMFEPVAGEGGVETLDGPELRMATAAFREAGALIVADEVQSGVYRTGPFLACHRLGVEPDLVTLAKGLGGGVPVGALVTTLKKGFAPGDHGTTFGGNPLAMRAGLTVLEILERVDVAKAAVALEDGLFTLKAAHPELFSAVTGMGLFRGLQVRDGESYERLRVAALEERVLVLPSGKNRLRFLPPLTIEKEELALGLARFATACEKVKEIQCKPQAA